jgi:cell division protein FtsQ
MKANKIRKISRKTGIFSIIRHVVVLIGIIVLAIVVYTWLYSSPIKSLFPVKQVVFNGNRHLSDDELKALAGVHSHDSLITLSSSKVSRQLLRSPWIKSVSIRKDLPNTLSMTIKEADPFALLEMNKHLFLVDEQGKLLEELRENSTPFLPVITGDPYKEKEALIEAIRLAKIMNDKGLSSGKDRIEIVAHKPDELAVTIDGIVVKIGAGGYEEKLDKLLYLEEDIKRLGIPVDYIDLRFAGKAIVKPATDKGIQ